MERRREPVFSSIDGHPSLTSVPAGPPADEGDRLHDCFELCLADFPEQTRSLILRYYEGVRFAKISNRRELAASLGLSESSLRSRVHRLRDRLEQCVQGCISKRG
jgi:DNA-directed RNA polymerase specialized sigma24 family protein